MYFLCLTEYIPFLLMDYQIDILIKCFQIGDIAEAEVLISYD